MIRNSSIEICLVIRAKRPTHKREVMYAHRLVKLTGLGILFIIVFPGSPIFPQRTEP